MAKSSKIHGLMVDKKEIFVYNVNDFVSSSTMPQEYLLETLKLLKSKSHAIKSQMNKKYDQKLQKNMGIRRNINFLVNFNLETEIVTRTDDEGTKNFIIKSENPFEPNLDYIADDKDFFTEQTEDEDEFLETSGYESKKRDKRAFFPDQEKHKSQKEAPRDIPGTNRSSQQLRREKAHILYSTEGSSSHPVSNLKNSIHQMSLDENQMRSSPGLVEFPFPKRKKGTSTVGKFKRNIFANFSPDPKQIIRPYELLLPYHTWMIVKNPCRQMRKQVSKHIYREITGQKRRRSSISVNIGKTAIAQKGPSYRVDNAVNILPPRDITFKESPDIQSLGKGPSEYPRLYTDATDLVNTFFIRADSSSDETSQIF